MYNFTSFRFFLFITIYFEYVQKHFIDIISHHYFDLDAEIVYAVCADHIQPLTIVVQQVLADQQ